MFDITEIVKAVLMLIVAIVGVFLVPYIKTKADAETLEMARYWVTVAVKCAEQIYKGTGLGEKKKAYVLEFLESKNLKLDTEEIDNMIEAIVQEMNAEVKKDE